MYPVRSHARDKVASPKDLGRATSYGMYHHILELKYTEEREHLFFATAAWWFGIGLIQIFVPIFLWSTGFSLAQIFLFFAIQCGVRALSVPLSLESSGKIGAKHVLSISLIFPLLFYLVFSKIPDIPNYFYLAAILMGLAQGYGWPAYHLHTSKITPDNNRGKTLAVIIILQIVTLAAAPAVGGYVIENFGIPNLIWTAAILFSFSAIVLINTKEIFSRHRLNTKLLGFRKVSRDAVANGFFNIRSEMSFVIWPLFMFTIIPGFKNIGFVEGLGTFFSIVAVYALGRLLDRGQRKRLLIWTSMLYIPVSIARILAFNPISLIILHIVYRIANRANGLVWISIFHSNLSRHPRVEYLFWVETIGAAMLTIAMFAFIFIAQVFEFKTTLIIAIIFGSLCAWISNLVSYREAEWSHIEAKN